jgi:hypothetical protein
MIRDQDIVAQHLAEGVKNNNQSPIAKLQLITNTQYSITKQRLAVIAFRLVIR